MTKSEFWLRASCGAERRVYDAQKALFRFVLLIAVFACVTVRAADVVDPSTLDGKVLLGYQGWFNCPAMAIASTAGAVGPAARRRAKTLTVDMYPGLDGVQPGRPLPGPGIHYPRAPAFLFSAMNPNVVDRHFLWMKDYGLDGVLVQSFVTDIPARSGGDVVLKNILDAARRHGRAFAIEYDVTGANPRTSSNHARRLEIPRRRTESHLASLLPASSRQAGALGLGHGTRNPGIAPRDPGTAMRVVNWFKAEAPPEQRVTYMGGVPRAGAR